ncbi:putative transcription factor [Camellia lanceoleosa]|uniref:Transcription factor n=1 Tax=Camellia lanceoleosa TaxID=1840588 RepID=A0ACC0I4J8_9ERIC|nr:putative transcription factor [Camellia lanceoleosa]
MNVFYDFIKKSLHIDVSKTQLFEKVRRLKKKYENNASKSKMGEDRIFSKAHEQKTYELSKNIWFGGANSVGVDSTKVNGKAKKNQSQRAIAASPRGR